jgi:hypothetical protein
MSKATDALTKLEARIEGLSKAILSVQWAGEGGHREEACCPFCGADSWHGLWGAYTPNTERSLELHAADCIVLAAYEVAGDAD